MEVGDVSLIGCAALESLTRSSATAKSTARPSCLVGVLWLINQFYILDRKASEFGEIMQTTRPLRRSRSFRVTDFGTNSKAHMRLSD